MKLNISISDDDLGDEFVENLAYLEKGQLFLSNTIDIKYVDFFRYILPEFNEIVYFEHNKPECPKCGIDMGDNGSREVKPNKLEGIHKKQYICPDCSKTQVTSLEPFISKYSNYSYDICEKGLNYDYIGYLSYDKKRELIDFENGIQIARQTIHYHQSTFDEPFLKRQEDINMELLKQKGIEPTGYYHYDEQYPHENGEQLVRLALIDAINNLPINDILIEKEDFNKEFVKAFLESSLANIPKEVLITDGAPMYPDIVDEIGIKHQLCVFHIIKNHHDKTFRSISRTSKRIKTIDKQIAANKTTMEMLKHQIKNNNLTNKKKKKKREKIKKLTNTNKDLREERRKKKKLLKELLQTNECIENIYNADDKKSSSRRFNTIHNRRKFIDNNSCSFLERLDKKFDRTVTYQDDPLIPKTNNGIERYFGITLPSNLKRKYRTTKGLTRWLRLQKIRWVRRNVLHENNLKNLSMTQYLEEKKNKIS